MNDAFRELAGKDGPCQGFSGPCPNVGTWQLQNTAYVDIDSNYKCFCPECQAESNEYWAERWAEYYVMTR